VPVPLGFVPGTRVATPDGDRPIEALRPGDAVLTWRDGALAAARVAAVHDDAADVLVAIVHERGEVRGCAPGTALLDVFEDAFRAAGSLSATSELLAHDGGVATSVAVLDVPERTVHRAGLVHLVLVRPDAAFFADGVLAGAKEEGT
jgi:hypothetical protein